MIGADTSVVVRYLVGTPESQAKRAAKLIDGAAEIGIPVLVIMETAHVLRTQYAVERGDVLDALIELLTRENLSVLGLPKPDALEGLVRARALPGTPLPDALIAATARWAGSLPLYTFDRDMHKHGIPVAEP